MKTGAILLSAGLSESMREFKPLLCLGQMPMIKHITDTLLSCKVSPLVVVTGHKAEWVKRCIDDTRVDFAHNRRYFEGDMLSSIKLGLSKISGKCDRALIMPADMPLVKRETILELLKADAQLIRPEFEGRYGHPIVVSSELFDDICSYKGTGGLKMCLDALIPKTVSVPVDDEGITMDANSDREFSRISELYTEKKGKGKLRLAFDLKLSADNAVIDSDIMQVLYMLDCTGSIQAASKLTGMPYARSWSQIKSIEEQLGYKLIESSAGGKNGGGTVLTERGSRLLEAYYGMYKEGGRIMDLLFVTYFSDEFV